MVMGFLWHLEYVSCPKPAFCKHHGAHIQLRSCFFSVFVSHKIKCSNIGPKYFLLPGYIEDSYVPAAAFIWNNEL